MFDFVLTEWNAWISKDKSITSMPDFIPKNLQRRLSPLAKSVLSTAASCIELNEHLPIVFSSAHGELSKSLAMLKEIQAGEELSPTSFSLSVHNAISGLFSIAYKNQAQITVLAPAKEGIVAAFIEALGILNEGSTDVLVIFYDEPVIDFQPLPDFNLNPDFSCVLVLRMSLTGEGLPLRLSDDSDSSEYNENAVQLLKFINFLTGKEMTLKLGHPNHSWIWQKKSLKK
jgi:hypothetical protein